jgi:prepilin-type N-terminal cleavage/methylation domain-containing protein
MKAKNPEPRGGFTLLELVIVLAILAVVTAVATREVGYVQDQHRFESSQRGLEELQEAVLGLSSALPADGAPQAAGFVADMGRLPRTAGTTNLLLSELWGNPGAPFDIRAAVSSNGVPVGEEDPQVLVPGGWRGPYVRLRLGAATLRDGWGNAYSSPLDATLADPDGAGYARLRDIADLPLVSTGQEVRVIRHLGANGRRCLEDTGYDQDMAIAFSNEAVMAGLKGVVEVQGADSAANPDPSALIAIRAFAPDPANASRIKVYGTNVVFAANPVIWEIPLTAGLTIGPRVVRAYVVSAGGGVVYPRTKSAVRTVTLRAGVNLLNLTIDR